MNGTVALVGTHGSGLVALACGVALVAAYVTLVVAANVIRSAGRARAGWIIGGAAIGLGVWSAQCIGVLSLTLPTAVGYDVQVMMLGVLAAMLAAMAALAAVRRAASHALAVVLAGGLLGGGMAVAHYLVLTALRMSPAIVHDPAWLAMSVAIAMAGSTVALWIALRWRVAHTHQLRLARLCSAAILALAIIGAHYAGVLAATFPQGSVSMAADGPFDPVLVASIIAAVTFLLVPVIYILGRQVAPDWHNLRWRRARIRTKLTLAFLLVAGLVTMLAMGAVLVQSDAARRASELEARHIGELIIRNLGDDPLGPQAALRVLPGRFETGDRAALIFDAEQHLVAAVRGGSMDVFDAPGSAALTATLHDGAPRTFVAADASGSQRAMHYVLPIRAPPQPSGAIVGALVLDYTPIYDQFVADSKSMIYLIAGVGAICTLAIAVFGLRMAGSVAGPLYDLEYGVRKLAAGDYGSRVSINTEDEIGELAGAFNWMAVQLSISHHQLLENQRELGRRVSARTAEALRAEAAQRSGAEELRVIADHMPAAMSYIGADMRVRYHNRRFAEWMGSSDVRIQGSTVRELLDTAGDSLVEDSMRAAMASGTTVSYERMQVARDGTQRYVMGTLVPRIEDGSVLGCYALAQDISDLKRTELALLEGNQALQRSNDQLHKAQDQLLQSEKMASVGQLAAGIAHEINNPIGYVHSNLGSLDEYVGSLLALMQRYQDAEQHVGDAGVREALRAERAKIDLDFLCSDVLLLMAESKEGISRVKKIVNDLKDFSHAASMDSWQWVDLHEGLNRTLNIVWNELKYKAELEKHYGELPQVRCMPSQLNQVFMNLLVNGGQAIKERGKITIRTGVVGDEVWLAFSDTGDGIAPGVLSRIFDPFFTTKPVGKGTGLGLSVSYGIVEKHGGRIEVASEPGHGATFTVWLPVSGPPAAAAVATIPPLGAEALAIPSG